MDVAARCQYPHHCRLTGCPSAAPATFMNCVPLALRRLSSRHAISPAYGVQVAADAVVLADLGPAQAREERLGLIGVRALVVERDAVVDPPRVVVGMQRIP